MRNFIRFIKNGIKLRWNLIKYLSFLQFRLLNKNKTKTKSVLKTPFFC